MRWAKYRYSRPTSRHSCLVLEEQTKRQARRREKSVWPCVNVACVPSRLHLSLSTQLAYDDDSLSPARLIPPKPLARKHEKNGGNPVRRNSTRYKIRCENRGRSRPRVRLESTADTSTEYLHQLAAPQASSTAFDLNFERPRLTEDEDGVGTVRSKTRALCCLCAQASSTQGEAAAYLIAGILTKDGVLRRTRSSTKCPERAGGRDDGTQMYMQ